MPFTCFWRATLVVPESAEEWSDERIDVVLRHGSRTSRAATAWCRR